MTVEVERHCEACEKTTVHELDTRSGETECLRCTAVGVISPAEVVEALA